MMEYLLFILVGIYFSDIFLSYIFLLKKRKKEFKFIQKKMLTSQQENSENKLTKIKGHVYNLIYGIIWHASKKIGKFPFHCLRVFIYRNIFKMKILKNSSVYHGCEIIAPWNIHLDEGSIIGIENKIDGRGGVYIGKNVNMSHQVNIWTMQHDFNDSYFSGVVGSVYINDYVWIGNRVTILPGIKIGKGAVIASGSVVTKDLDEYGVYAGIPAKKIADRNKDLKYKIGLLPII